MPVRGWVENAITNIHAENMRISNIMIGVVLISLFSVVFTLNLSQGARIYGQSFDNATMQSYNKMNEITSQTEKVKTQTEQIAEQQGALDVIGSYFSRAYQALALTKASVDSLDSMSNKAIGDAGLGETGQYFRIAITTIILIVIFIAIILSALIKREM